MILVIAGSHQEFEYWRRQKRLSPRDVRYVYSEEQLLGIRGATLEKWGHWQDSPIWKVPGIRFRLEEVQRR